MRKPSRSLAALAVVSLLALAAPRPAASVVLVEDAIHTAHTIAHYIARAYEIFQKAEQIRRQVEQIQYQLQALKKLQNPNWREVATLLWNLDNLMRQGQALAYSLEDIDAQFRATFPGWTPWVNWKDDNRRQVERTLDTMRAGLNTVNRASRLIADQFTLGDIKKQMATVQGHQEALEMLATLQAFTAEEQILTRQALATQNNMVSVYYGYRLNAEAQAHATHLAILERTARRAQSSPSPGFTFRPGWSLF